jgi:protein tyrosine phosphatase (PTP) superfamily phosphohydrolase (DUF442 family)
MDWVIEKKIAVGNQYAGANVDHLLANGIKTIVCGKQDLPFPLTMKEYRKLGLDGVIHVPLRDDGKDALDTNLLSHMVKLVDAALSRGDGGVLFFCAAGISRSVFLTAWYLMNTSHSDLLKVHDYETDTWKVRDIESIMLAIRCAHPESCPNKQFCQWLGAKHRPPIATIMHPWLDDFLKAPVYPRCRKCHSRIDAKNQSLVLDCCSAMHCRRCGPAEVCVLCGRKMCFTCSPRGYGYCVDERCDCFSVVCGDCNRGVDAYYCGGNIKRHD